MIFNGIPQLIGSGIILTVALLILIYSKRSLTNILFSFLSMAIAIHMFGIGMLFYSHILKKVLFWHHFIHIGVIFIPIILYHFYLSFIKRKVDYLLVIGYLLAGTFQVLNILGVLIPESKISSASLFYPYYSNNPVFLLFLSYLCGYDFFTTFQLYRIQKNERISYRKKRYKWIFIGILFGQLGALDYLPFFFSLDWWHAYGSYFTVVGIFVLFYAFLKYDIDVPNKAVKKAVIISVVSIILIIVNVFFIMVIYSIMKIKISAFQIAFIIAPFFVFLLSYEKLREVIAKKVLFLFFPNQKESLQLLTLYNDILINAIDIDTMMVQVSSIIKAQFGSFNCALFLLEKENGNIFFLKNSFGEIGVKKNNTVTIPQESWRLLLNYDFICVSSNNSFQTNKDGYNMLYQRDFFGVKESIVIPLVYKRRILGILVFTEKENEVMIDESDFNIIKILKSELSLVLYNIRLFEFENRKELSEKIIADKRQNYRDKDFEGIVSTNEKITEIFYTIKAISDKDVTVMITGESGTGKELFARAIHQNSKRKGKPFITINCAAIPGELLEAELFGYEKGAFTGAFKTHVGKFEEANGGTVFLDEIAEIEPYLQVKLLRFIEDRTIEKIGSNKKTQLDVRIISATNKDLENMVKENTFREDLFYRLNVVRIKLPSLRERGKDINLLVWYYLTRISKEYKMKTPEVTVDAMNILETYDWPGNIRELKNTIAQILAINKNVKIIEKYDIPKHIIDSITCQTYTRNSGFSKDIWRKGNLDLKTGLEEYERMMISEVYENTGKNQSETAKILNIGRSSLQYKLKKYGVK